MADFSNGISPQLIIEMVLRRRWLIIFPFCIAMIIGIYLAISLPKVYEANTLILVQPQKVPSEYVRSLVVTDFNDRVNTISQQILSRYNLEKIIDEFNLFNGPGYEKMFFEDKIGALRKNINVKVTKSSRGGEGGAFSISFRGKEPEKVMKVVNTLASYFIDENLKLREASAMGTTDFLDVELNEIKKKLEENELALKNYREQYMGGLPEQLQTNLNILGRLQEKYLSNEEGMRDAKARLDSLEVEAKSIENLQISMSGDALDSSEVDDETRLIILKKELSAMKLKYTDQHPDIIRLNKKISKLETSIAQKKTAAPDKQNGEKTALSVKNYSKSEMDLINRKRDLLIEIGGYRDENKKLAKQIEMYQKRVEDTPKREQELLSINRDYENTQATYNSILQRKLEAQLALNMEKKQKGEQFRVLDSARLPEKPVSPDMRKLFLFMIAVGLGIGGGLAFLPEFLDKSFRSPEEIETSLDLPVISIVPFIVTQKHIMKQHVINILSLVGVAVSVALLGVFGVLTQYGVEKTFELINKIV